MTTLTESDVVIITNESDRVFSDRFDGREFTIQPGREAIIPFAALCLWLGHPYANNYDPRNRVRVMEHQRLRTRYGAFDDIIRGLTADQLWELNRPRLAARTYEGEAVITVVDDPDGNFLAPPDESGTSDQSQLALIMATIQRQERELNALKAQAAASQRRDSALYDAEPTSDDAPEMVNPHQPRPDIPGSVVDHPIINPAPDDESTVAPRPPVRTSPSEDTPTRVVVSSS